MSRNPAIEVELRGERAYDEQSPSTLICPGGSLAAYGPLPQWRPDITPDARTSASGVYMAIAREVIAAHTGRCCSTCGRPVSPSDEARGICTSCGEILDQRRTA